MSLVYDKFILFGDSLTEFGTGKGTDFSFQGELQDNYMRKLDVENRSFAGYNTRHARLLLPEILNADIGASKIKLMTMYFGCNDASKMYYVPVEEYEENIEYLANEILKRDIKLIIIGTGFHDQELFRNIPDIPYHGPVNSNKQTKVYSEAAKRVASKLQVPFVDLWEAFRQFGNWTEKQLLADEVDLSELLIDGIHFKAQAYRIFYKEVKNAIDTGLPEVAPAALPKKLPEWNDNDIEKVRQALADLAK
ncbi:isoamyl acetate esterase [Scheffersomyces coipomensis]|uniref:isoamyl acetate esterase n=1 Tax=Scheffersomyces coipomensis TaxID=1788519 RepID=UPI00315D1541